MPKVSVIIPTYNREKYIIEAVESVLNQTYKDYEIIIIDDGSTDNTKQVLDEYLKGKGFRVRDKSPSHKAANPQGKTDDVVTWCRGDFCVRYFYQENKGISAARNKAINEAKGDYIAFLDSDDRWLPKKLEKQMKVIKDENINFVYSAMYVENNGRMINKIISASPATDFLGLLTKNQSIAMGTTVIKKEHITKTGMFDENLRVSVDCDL